MSKIIKFAHIETVKSSELNVGDYILWAHLKAQVIKINELNKFIVIINPTDNKERSCVLHKYYFRIISCEETEVLEE